MGSGIEYGLGPWRTIILYWLSGLGGILLSMCVHPVAHGVGASTAIFGLVGFYFSYLFTNFNYMGRTSNGQRWGILVYTLIMLLMNTPLLPGDARTDTIGHLGGFVTGTFVGFAISEQYDADARAAERVPDKYTREEYEDKSECCCFFRRFYLVVSILWFLGLFLYFYLGIDLDSLPEEDDYI